MSLISDAFMHVYVAWQQQSSGWLRQVPQYNIHIYNISNNNMSNICMLSWASVSSSHT